MASKRRITTRQPQFGKARSHAFNTTNRQFKLNIQSKRIYIPELKRFVRVQLSANELKTVDRIGLPAFLQRQGRSIQELL